jgi:sugar phosphate isomerase/epimerase
MLELAVNGYDFKTWRPEDTAAFLKEIGVRYFELQYDMEGGPPDEYARALEQRGIGLSGVYTSSKYALNGDDNPATCLRVINECIDLAGEFGAPNVLIYLGVTAKRNTTQAIDYIAELLRPLLDTAARSGLNVAVENLFDVKGNDPQCTDVVRTAESLCALFAKVDAPNFGLNFDACNFYIAGLEAWPYSYARLKERVMYVHLKNATTLVDKNGPRWPAGPVVHDGIGGDFAFVPVGAGAVNFDGFLRQHLASGYEGFLVVEGLAEPLEETYRSSLEFVRRYV